MTLDEVMKNEPIDVEMERMKRGYGAKQFARMKPYLKPSWIAANHDAPPPFPTFGDIKSWNDHAGEGHGPKPAWAGTTRLAMPKEVFDAAAKGPDGKPLYPPAWMPIHHMAVWNYIAKKAGSEGNPYQTVNPYSQGKVNAANQAGYQEGIAINALRKYVQMRGGADQLVDIPRSKLAEMGLNHNEIFKAKKGYSPHLTDDELKEIVTTKIVDPVALTTFLDEEMSGKKVKKSFSLVIPTNAPSHIFRKAYVVGVREHELMKAKVAKISSAIVRKLTTGK
jgi:hypothetical protein